MSWGFMDMEVNKSNGFNESTFIRFFASFFVSEGYDYDYDFWASGTGHIFWEEKPKAAKESTKVGGSKGVDILSDFCIVPYRISLSIPLSSGAIWNTKMHIKIIETVKRLIFR
jgi:hypothetical protein